MIILGDISIAIVLLVCLSFFNHKYLTGQHFCLHLRQKLSKKFADVSKTKFNFISLRVFRLK